MNRAYHSDFEHISTTMLKHFAHSPNDFCRYYVEQNEPLPTVEAGKIGNICHQVLLEEKPFGACVREYPQECYKRGGKSLQAYNHPSILDFLRQCREDGVEPVKPKELQQVQRLVEAVVNHQVVQVISSASEREQAYRWRDETGVLCRCKPDIEIELADEVLIYDLKFSHDPSPRGFKRTARNLKYWLQDAHYSAGLYHKYGKPVKFAFWVIEDQFPFRIARYHYTDDSRERAGDERWRLLTELARCRESGNWVDPWCCTEDLLVSNELWLDENEVGTVEIDFGGESIDDENC